MSPNTGARRSANTSAIKGATGAWRAMAVALAMAGAMTLPAGAQQYPNTSTTLYIDGNTPVRKDTQVGLEFQGLTGIAAISFTGGSDDAPPPPKGADGIPELTADPDGTLGMQEKIRVALRNVDKVISDNEVAVQDTLRNFETFTASLSGSGERITSIISIGRYCSEALAMP